jgi:hypothetical protein
MEQKEVVGWHLPEGPERQSHEARRLEGLRRLRGRSSTSNCHMSLAADLGLAEKRCCSQSLAGSRRQESPRPRRARETSPYSETPWAKSSSSSILPHSIRQDPAFCPTWHRAIVTPQLCFDGTRRCLYGANAAGYDTCSSSADGRAALMEIFCR